MTTPPNAAEPSPPVCPVTRKTRALVIRGELLGDRFEVDEFVSDGGTSVVYTCKDRALRCAAAVKLLTDPSEDARRRFLDEGRILANLRHPHLVQVLAVGETTANVPYIVLELLPGQSLAERLRERGPLPWREAAELLEQVAGALAKLHLSGVIHRDLKPGNIVQLESATGRPLVKLIDLGIAKVLDWHLVQGGGFTPSPRHETQANLVVGTPGYYPPFDSADPRRDTYALGVTLYELCTGVLPAPGALRPMNEVRPACGAPPDLERLVATAVAVLPEDRVATAEEFQRRLEAIRGHGDDASPHLFDGCYELLQLMGAGAQAEVYRAYHRDMARYVALKLLPSSSLESAEQRRRFANEALALSAVSHPALPKLIECRTSAQRRRPYIAMSLVRGVSAQPHCLATNRLRPADVIAVGKCLAGALAELHAHGILHRDIKAGNVIIDFGRETTATLIDIGMAEFEDKFYALVERRYPTRPEDRVKLGTGGLELLEWTAPEARATKVWTARSDVYSLGLLLYRLLTGKRPAARPGDDPTPPQTHVPDCPTALATALLAALHADPNDRVDARELLAKLDAAADELADELTGHAADDVGVDEKVADELAEPVVSTPVSSPPTSSVAAPRRTGSHGLTWSAIAVTMTLTLAGIIWLGSDRSPAPRVLDETSATPARVVAAPQERPAERAPQLPVLAVVTPSRLPAMQEALDAVAADLRRCSRLAGEPLILQFTTVADSDMFATVAAGGNTNPAVDRCVREATTAVRFQPAGPQKFTQEYKP